MVDKNQFLPDLLLDQTFDNGSVILIVIVAIIGFILFQRRRYSDGHGHRFDPLSRSRTPSTFNPFSFSSKMPPSGIKILEENFEFFRHFNPKQQRHFASRVMLFIRDKKFEGRDQLKITFKMKILIAATAVRVTLGLKTFTFPSFHTILIYPEKFYSGFSKAVVKGETNMAGVMVLSWQDFLFGVSDQNDNLNLGYHEFGHALFVERFRETMDSKFMDNYDRWRRLVFSKGKLREAELKQTFRAYANYNEHEFFAVAVENFLERPEKFKRDLPNLYALMTKMLNQDPLSTDR